MKRQEVLKLSDPPQFVTEFASFYGDEAGYAANPATRSMSQYAATQPTP